MTGGGKVFRAVLLGMAWIVAPAALIAQAGVDPSSPACTPAHQQDTATVDQYLFKTYQSNDGACFQVLRDGKVIFSDTQDAEQFNLGQPADPEFKIPAIANGTDVTGSGHPEMIVTSWTGGAHCCMAHLLFQLEPQFKLLAEIDDENDSTAHFEMLDHHYYYMTHEQVFAYWNTDYADSPMPKVILRYSGGAPAHSFHLALDKMRRKPQEAADWQKLVAATQAAAGSPGSSDIADPELWGNLLDLIYSDQARLAWKLLDEAWPPGKPGKDDFVANFCSQLKTSPYWQDLAPGFRDAPAACANAEPAPQN
jgi:hypothetical protein